jgi:hypothetical protein
VVQGLPWRAATVPRGRVARASARLDGIGVKEFRVQGPGCFNTPCWFAG